MSCVILILRESTCNVANDVCKHCKTCVTRTLSTNCVILRGHNVMYRAQAQALVAVVTFPDPPASAKHRHVIIVHVHHVGLICKAAAQERSRPIT